MLLFLFTFILLALLEIFPNVLGACIYRQDLHCYIGELFGRLRGVSLCHHSGVTTFNYSFHLRCTVCFASINVCDFHRSLIQAMVPDN